MSDHGPGAPTPPGGWIEIPSSTPPPPPLFGPPGTPPLPPPLGPEGGDPRPRRRPWVPIAVVAALLVAGGVAFVAVGDDDADTPSAESAEDPDEPSTTYPDAWDPRLEDLVDFVEHERDLRFEHPVAVEFLDEEAWKEQAAGDDEDLSEEDEQLLEHGEGLFRAVGLAEGDLDLQSDSETLGASGTVGSYSFDDETIRVRGEEITPKVAATLAHELTHVLQDQHFDIGDRLEVIADEDTDEESLRVLVEGDADRIEDLWVQALPDDERATLDDQRAEESTTAEEALDDLPESLVTFFASSYILGAGFLDVLEAADGTAAIDDAFESPPGPEEHVLDPIAFLDGDDASEVEPPEVDGTPIEDMDGEFGAVSWYLVLAERTDPVAALAAVDGWGGDQFVAYTDDDGRTCAALRFVGEADGDAARLEGVAEQWAKAMPAEADVSVVREGDTVDLRSCDPGPEATLLQDGGRSKETITVVAVRSELASQVLTAGATPEQARCFSRGLLGDVGYEVLTIEKPTAAQTKALQEAAAARADACR